MEAILEQTLQLPPHHRYLVITCIIQKPIKVLSPILFPTENYDHYTAPLSATAHIKYRWSMLSSAENMAICNASW